MPRRVNQRRSESFIPPTHPLAVLIARHGGRLEEAAFLRGLRAFRTQREPALAEPLLAALSGMFLHFRQRFAQHVPVVAFLDDAIAEAMGVLDSGPTAESYADVLQRLWRGITRSVRAYGRDDVPVSGLPQAKKVSPTSAVAGLSESELIALFARRHLPTLAEARWSGQRVDAGGDECFLRGGLECAPAEGSPGAELQATLPRALAALPVRDAALLAAVYGLRGEHPRSRAALCKAMNLKESAFKMRVVRATQRLAVALEQLVPGATQGAGDENGVGGSAGHRVSSLAFKRESVAARERLAGRLARVAMQAGWDEATVRQRVGRIANLRARGRIQGGCAPLVERVVALCEHLPHQRDVRQWGRTGRRGHGVPAGTSTARG